MLIMIEYYIQKEKINVVDTVVAEITSNPEKNNTKIKINNLPMYGIISLIIVVIGGIVVSMNFSSLSVSFATPILLVSVITAGAGIEADVIRGTSIIGLISGIVLLFISLTPVILYVANLFVL